MLTATAALRLYGQGVLIDADPVGKYYEVGQYRVFGGRRKEPLAIGVLVERFAEFLRWRRRVGRYLGRCRDTKVIIHPVPGEFLDSRQDCCASDGGSKVHDTRQMDGNLYDDVPRAGNQCDRA